MLRNKSRRCPDMFRPKYKFSYEEIRIIGMVEEILSSLRGSRYSKCKLLFEIIENRLLHLKWDSD